MSKPDDKDWRSRNAVRRDRKLMMMRGAKTAAENRYAISGALKSPGRSQKPVTLPKTPWDEDKES